MVKLSFSTFELLTQNWKTKKIHFELLNRKMKIQILDFKL